jgi:hypothetical protein
VRKTLVALLVLGLVAGSLAAPAGAKKNRKKTRVAEATYANPAIGIGGVVSSGSAGGSVEFPLTARESFISIDITDESGSDVYASLSQDTDTSTPSWEIFAGICGRTDEPIPVTPGITVRVTITAGPGSEYPTCAGTPISGTVKAKISNLP